MNLVDDAPWHRDDEEPDISPADKFDFNYSQTKLERDEYKDRQ